MEAAFSICHKFTDIGYVVQLQPGQNLCCGLGTFAQCSSRLVNKDAVIWQFSKCHMARTLKPFRSTVRCSAGPGEPEDDFLYAYIDNPPYTSYVDPISKEPSPAFGYRSPVADTSFWNADPVRTKSYSSDLPAGSISNNERPGQPRKRGRRRKQDTKTSSTNMLTAHTEDKDFKREENFESGEGKFDEEVAGSTELNNAANEEEDEEEEDDEVDGKVKYEALIEEEPEMTPEEIANNNGSYPLNHYPKGKKWAKSLPEPLPKDQLWWNRQRPGPKDPDGVWTRWQTRTPTKDAAMAAAMQAAGQIKLYGDTPTLCEELIHRARRRVFYEERIEAEEKRKKEIGSMAYYKEWVKAWKRDTSLEAVQKHYEETGEDVAIQLMNMLSVQTEEEYRLMRDTDSRMRKDPLSMRASKEHKKMVYGGDPVYPTANYIQDPKEKIDYRGPNFHDPTPTVEEYLKARGRMITQEQLDKILAKEEADQEEFEDDATEEGATVGGQMAEAVDIGEKEDAVDDDEENEDKDISDAKAQGELND